MFFFDYLYCFIKSVYRKYTKQDVDIYALALLSLIIYLHVYFICIIQKLLLTGTTIITLLISISLVFFVRYFFTKKEMYCKELENTKNQILKFFLFYFIFISVIVLVTSIVKFYL